MTYFLFLNIGLLFSSGVLPLSSCLPQAASTPSFSPWAGCPSPSPTPADTGKMSPQCNKLGPAPAAPEPQPSGTIETVALWYANMYRCNHTDTNLLVWNSTLAQWAQECGDKCSGHCMGSDAPGVLPGGFIVPYEQIGFSGPSDNNMADAMEAWYIGVGTDSFAAEFNADGTPTGKDSHGSRVIWRASTQMGCAASHCPGNANSDSFSVMCHFGNGVSWNQVSKPGTCNPTEQDVKINLGKPLGHLPPSSGSNTYSQGYTIPDSSPASETSMPTAATEVSGGPSITTSSSASTFADGGPSYTNNFPVTTGWVQTQPSNVINPQQSPTTTTENVPGQSTDAAQDDCDWD